MEKERTLQEIADSICRRLKKKGFSILRYDAMSTDSIYLKLDYGVCNSIRIGGHRGKSKLKYRYNIGTNIKKVEQVHDQFTQFYYPASEEDRLIQRILFDRKVKREQYGSRYAAFMAQNKTQMGRVPGFWSSAHEV